MNELKLNINDQQKLNALAEIINEVSNEFTIKTIIDNLSIKQQLLYLNFVVVNSYSEAIFKLCIDFRPLPANVILRSLVESFINTAYVLTHNSNKRALLFTLEDSFYRKGLATEVITFLKKYPQFEKGEFNSQSFGKALINIQREIDFYKSRYNLDYKNRKDFVKDYPALIDRAKAVDNRINKPDFEHIYTLVYRYLSEFGHLSMRGLNNFVIKDLNGNFEMIASQHNDISVVISMTYTIYLYFVDQLKKRKILRNNFPFSKFDKYWKKYFNSPDNSK